MPTTAATNEEKARAWVERETTLLLHNLEDWPEWALHIATSAVAATVRLFAEEAAAHFEADAASCRGYGGAPHGPDPMMHSDAHDYCHARFEAAQWLREHAGDIPKLPR